MFKKSKFIVISSTEIGHNPLLHSSSDQVHKHVPKAREELSLVLTDGLMVFCKPRFFLWVWDFKILIFIARVEIKVIPMRIGNITNGAMDALFSSVPC